MTQMQTNEIQRYIMFLPYPCSKKELADNARAHGANGATIRAIQNLPYDYFMSPDSVRKAIQK